MGSFYAPQILLADDYQESSMQPVGLVPLPRVIFLDAVGTLFGVKGSVGEVYSSIAEIHGVQTDAEAVNRAFFASFRLAGSPAFPMFQDPTELQAQEFSWWMAIAQNTFKQVGVLQQFPDFARFFADLYQHFATAEPWVVYPDVLPSLQRLQRLGIPLAILSNFDSRLHSVLKALELTPFFSSITLSTESGVAKPDLQIFNLALQKQGCTAAEAWHIGDSYTEDYQAARAAGLRGIWLRRP
jgi:putative hydrolase of the HAD superfamily